jgi:hypothetical protein
MGNAVIGNGSANWRGDTTGRVVNQTAAALRPFVSLIPKLTAA